MTSGQDGVLLYMGSDPTCTVLVCNTENCSVAGTFCLDQYGEMTTNSTEETAELPSEAHSPAANTDYKRRGRFVCIIHM
jgi:hypothetical protein